MHGNATRSCGRHVHHDSASDEPRGARGGGLAWHPAMQGQALVLLPPPPPGAAQAHQPGAPVQRAFSPAAGLPVRLGACREGREGRESCGSCARDSNSALGSGGSAGAGSGALPNGIGPAATGWRRFGRGAARHCHGSAALRLLQAAPGIMVIGASCVGSGMSSCSALCTPQPCMSAWTGRSYIANGKRARLQP